MNRKIKRYMLPLLRGRCLVIGLALVVLAMVVAMGVCLHGRALEILASGLAVVPFLGVTLSEEDFQRKVLGGLEAQDSRMTGLETTHKKATEQILADVSRADKEVRKALEDLAKVQTWANETDAILKKMAAVQKAVALNARSSFGDPIRRALQDEEVRFSLNAFVRTVLARRFPEVKVDPAYTKHVDEAITVARALTGVDAGLGQAVVPQQTFDAIYDTLQEYGDYSSLGIMRVGARTTVLPLATSRPQFYWIGSQSGQAEGSTITSGAFSGTQVLLIIQTLAVLMYVARELLMDSTVDLAPYVLREMVQSVAWGMDTASFVGTGNADQTSAGYVGLFQAPAANSNLAAVAGQGNTTIGSLLLEDFENVLMTVNPIVLKRPGAKWWMHPQVMAKTALIRDKMGRPLFQPFSDVPEAGGIGKILGYPVHLTAIAPSLDSNGQPVAAFGDPEGVAVGIRQDLELATSEDIGFPQNLMAYRTLMRAGVHIKTVAASTTLKPVAVLQTSVN